MTAPLWTCPACLWPIVENDTIHPTVVPLNGRDLERVIGQHFTLRHPDTFLSVEVTA